MNKYDIYPYGDRFAVRGENPSGLGDTILNTYTEAEQYVELQKRIDRESRETLERIEREEQKAADDEQAMIDSYRGFLSGSAMKNGKIRKTLERTIVHNGKVLTRKQIVEQKIESGWHVEDGQLTDGDYVYPGTKTEKDYARFLLDNGSE